MVVFYAAQQQLQIPDKRYVSSGQYSYNHLSKPIINSWSVCDDVSICVKYRAKLLSDMTHMMVTDRRCDIEVGIVVNW